MRIYEIYQNDQSAEPLLVGRIRYHPASNTAELFLNGSGKKTFHSVNAALTAARAVYSEAYLEAK